MLLHLGLRQWVESSSASLELLEMLQQVRERLEKKARKAKTHFTNIFHYLPCVLVITVFVSKMSEL